jgi:hypothetical protein
MDNGQLVRRWNRGSAALGSAVYLLGAVVGARADDAVAPPWHGADIGSPSLAGGTDNWASKFVTSASGGDIWSTSDQFHYTYYQLTGDGQLVARVQAQSSADPWSKAGVMMRSSLAADSPFVDVVVTPSNGVSLQVRQSSAAQAGGGGSVSGGAPYWVKLVRIGNTVTGYAAVDSGGAPGAWSASLGSWTCSGTIYAGLCVTSHNNGVLGTATFDNVKTTGEQAVSADAFVDSMGVCHGSNSSYNTLLTGLGIRHVRDGWSANIPTIAASGVKLTQVTGPLGIGPIDGAGNPIGPAYNGTISDINTIRDQIKARNVTGGGPRSVVEAVEGPNEPDLFWGSWYNCTYNGQGSPSGPLHFQQDLYSVIKADPATAGLTVIGTAWGGTPSSGANPWPTGSMTASVDWGNFHAYPGGDPFTYGQGYDTIFSNGDTSPWIGSLGYTRQGNAPSNRLNYTHGAFFAPYTAKAMATTETGYYTGSAKYALSQNVFAKYVPRLYLEHFNAGVPRMYLYCFDDLGTNLNDNEQNRGLIYNNGTAKPAYTALKSLITLLKESTFNTTTHMWSAPAFTPGTLNYSISVSPVNGYTEPNSGVTTNYNRTEYVHHLLMQRSSGSYYLALWHEVSDASYSDINGADINGPCREIVPPAMPTTITLPASITSATCYSYDANWNLQPSTLTINGSHQITLNVPDKVVVVKLN